ncbi:MAG: transcriptional regulator [Rhodobacteraceae bacterium PARR1]|nr:MAG: transcriptional regulator [Rhodobacteraceae bacterium PARR1]
MTETRIHPATGQVLMRQVRKQTVSFGSLRADVDVPGWYPEGEGDSIHSGRDLADKEAAFQALRKTYGDRVRAIRKILKLSQVEAGTLVGGGPRAFQKYEKGIMAPSDAAIGLLEILSVDPQKLDVLRRLRKDGSAA